MILKKQDWPLYKPDMPEQVTGSEAHVDYAPVLAILRRKIDELEEEVNKLRRRLASVERKIRD